MRTSICAVALVGALWGSAHAEEALSLPDPSMTPGVVDPAATWDVVCNETTRTRRHVSKAMRARVLGDYNIPAAEASDYEIDHLVPLAIGGANVVANLWPQPWDEAMQKDVLEVELQRRVCHRLIIQADAQREVADDWTGAYTRYVGGTPIAAPDPGKPASETAEARPDLRSRLKARLLRWSRRWIFGKR